MLRFAFALFALACGGKGDPITVVTYNAGLAVGFVDAAEDRAPMVADALTTLDADVVCMQEVWRPDHVALMEGSFPESGFAEPLQDESTGAPACADGDIDALITCTNDNCSDACQDEIVDCVFANCVGQFLGLPKTCQGCAMAEVGGTPEDIQATCESQSTAYAYDGSFGTGILSKHPMSGYEHTVFDSTTNRRGAEHAVIESPMGDVDVYCTHLTATFDLIPYPRETGSWEEEQLAQIAPLHDWIDETAQSDIVILMGDFNMGPSIPDAGIVADNGPHYDELVKGFTNFYTKGDPECTFCGDNVLVGEGDDKLIDHILVKGDGFEGTGEGTRIYTDEITALSCDTEIPATLSDHYGLSMVLTP